MSEQDACPLGRWRAVLLDWSDLPLRAVLAATFLVHGYGKVFEGGAAGLGMGLEKGGIVPFPYFMAWLAATAEFAGGLGMVVGLGTRLAALGHMVVMAVAVLTVHGVSAWGMNVVDGKMQGIEWQVGLFLTALCLFMRGAGPLSLDRAICNWWCARKAKPSGEPASG